MEVTSMSLNPVLNYLPTDGKWNHVSVSVNWGVLTYHLSRSTLSNCPMSVSFLVDRENVTREDSRVT